MLINKTLMDFINETSSGAPTPGGGSVSALAGALGAALGSMVGEITLTKAEDKDSILEIQGKIKICSDLMNSLNNNVDEDTAAYDRVMAAYKMPKSTDDEKKIRSQSIQEALKGAAETPYETALLCIDVMNISLDMLKCGSKNAASDASVAGFLGYAALNGALYNTRLNLNSIKDADYVASMRSKVRELITEGEALLEKIKVLSAEVIGGI